MGYVEGRMLPDQIRKQAAKHSSATGPRDCGARPVPTVELAFDDYRTSAVRNAGLLTNFALGGDLVWPANVVWGAQKTPGTQGNSIAVSRRF